VEREERRCGRCWGVAVVLSARETHTRGNTLGGAGMEGEAGGGLQSVHVCSGVWAGEGGTSLAVSRNNEVRRNTTWVLRGGDGYRKSRGGGAGGVCGEQGTQVGIEVKRVGTGGTGVWGRKGLVSWLVTCYSQEGGADGLTVRERTKGAQGGETAKVPQDQGGHRRFCMGLFGFLAAKAWSEMMGVETGWKGGM